MSHAPWVNEPLRNPEVSGECEECKALQDAMLSAVREIVRLHELHARSIILNRPDDGFDVAIHEANEQRQNAKYAYILHKEAHAPTKTAPV